MPRELYLVSSRAMTLADLVEAAAQVDGSLVLRALREGASLQLVDTDDVAVVTVDVSRQVFDATDVDAVMGGTGRGAMVAPGHQPDSTDARWWTQATAPWSPAGATGVRVVDELSVLLGGTALLVEDGR